MIKKQANLAGLANHVRHVLYFYASSKVDPQVVVERAPKKYGQKGDIVSYQVMNNKGENIGTFMPDFAGVDGLYNSTIHKPPRPYGFDKSDFVTCDVLYADESKNRVFEEVRG